MRTIMAAVAAAFSAGAALACDDHHGTCEIEDYRANYDPEVIRIEGVATCDTGWIVLRLYDGEGEGRKFIGVGRAFIEGHIFRDNVWDVAAKPAALSIKYSIEQK